MEVKTINKEILKKAIKQALANVMLEQDFCLEREKIMELLDQEEIQDTKVLTLGGKKNGCME